jgi:hypothetical protein
MALFCFATVAFLASRDLFHAETRDVEVWLGLEVHGRAAQATAPLHWAIFATAGWGFWTQRPWIWRAAAGYVFYVALSHLVWSEASPHGNGWPLGLLQMLAISLPGFWLLRAGGAKARAR